MRSGQTVNIAARVQNLAGGDEICITEDVYDAEGVAEIIAAIPGDKKSEAELRSTRPCRCYHLALTGILVVQI